MSLNDSPAAGAAPTTGLSVVEQAVAFTNAQVLDPTAGLSGSPKSAGMDVGGKALADQAVGMMVQDLRGFVQSMEMILVVAAAKAIEKMLGGPEGGAAAATHVTALMRELPAFAAGMSALGNSLRENPPA